MCELVDRANFNVFLNWPAILLSTNCRRLEEAIFLENPIHGNLPQKVALNPLFNKNVMFVYHFDPYIHMPSDIGHDPLLVIFRKENFTFKCLNLASKGTCMSRLNMLCGSEQKKMEFYTFWAVAHSRHRDTTQSLHYTDNTTGQASLHGSKDENCTY